MEFRCERDNGRPACIAVFLDCAFAEQSFDAARLLADYRHTTAREIERISSIFQNVWPNRAKRVVV